MRWWVGLLVAVALAAGGLVAGEAYVRGQLVEQLALGAQRELALPQRPTVALKGGPVLFDLVRQQLQGVHLSTTEWPMQVSGRAVTLRDPEVDADRIAIRGNEVVVGEVTGSVTLTATDLGAIAGLPIETSTDRLTASYTFEALGLKLTARASGRPELDVANQTVTIADARLALVGTTLDLLLPPDVISRLVKPIPITLDYGLKLQSVRVQPTGLELSVKAQDLTVVWRR